MTTSDGWPYEQGHGTSLNPIWRPIVPVTEASTQPATPPDITDPPPTVLVDDITDPPTPTVLDAVRTDLAALGDLTGGARRSFAAVAVGLAESFDVARAGGAPPSVIAKLAQELRATLQALTAAGTNDHNRLTGFLDEMGAATVVPPTLGNPTNPQPADPRPPGGGASGRSG